MAAHALQVKPPEPCGELARWIIHRFPARPQFFPDKQTCVINDITSSQVTIAYKELTKDALLEFYRAYIDDICFTRMEFFNIDKYYEDDELE